MTRRGSECRDGSLLTVAGDGGDPTFTRGDHLWHPLSIPIWSSPNCVELGGRKEDVLRLILEEPTIRAMTPWRRSGRSDPARNSYNVNPQSNTPEAEHGFKLHSDDHKRSIVIPVVLAMSCSVSRGRGRPASHRRSPPQRCAGGEARTLRIRTHTAPPPWLRRCSRSACSCRLEPGRRRNARCVRWNTARSPLCLPFGPGSTRLERADSFIG